MTRELRRSLPLAVLFVIGLAAGVWTFIAPWTVGYPIGRTWTAPVWTSVWAGGIVAATSAIALVVVLARAVHATLAQSTRTPGA